MKNPELQNLSFENVLNFVKNQEGSIVSCKDQSGQYCLEFFDDELLIFDNPDGILYHIQESNFSELSQQIQDGFKVDLTELLSRYCQEERIPLESLKSGVHVYDQSPLLNHEYETFL